MQPVLRLVQRHVTQGLLADRQASSELDVPGPDTSRPVRRESIGYCLGVDICVEPYGDSAGFGVFLSHVWSLFCILTRAPKLAASVCQSPRITWLDHRPPAGTRLVEPSGTTERPM